MLGSKNRIFNWKKSVRGGSRGLQKWIVVVSQVSCFQLRLDQERAGEEEEEGLSLLEDLRQIFWISSFTDSISLSSPLLRLEIKKEIHPGASKEEEIREN